MNTTAQWHHPCPRSGGLSTISASNGIEKCWFSLSGKNRKSIEKPTEEEGKPTKNPKLLMTSSISVRLKPGPQ